MVRVFLVAVMVFIADQLSKWWVLERLFAHKLTNADGIGFKAWISASSLPTLPPVQIEFLPFFNLSMAWNKGISFSMFYSESAQMPLILSGFAIGVACAFLVWAYKNHHRGERLGIALIVGGALANAYDRIRFGAVADFLDVFYKDWHYPAFNLADSAITIGVGVILLYGFVLNRKG